jgi:hypothetical protein
MVNIAGVLLIVILASLLLAVAGGILNRAQEKSWPQTLLSSGAIFIVVATFLMTILTAAKVI